MGKRSRTLSSDGTDTRSAAEIKAEIETAETEAPPQVVTPDRAEPETQPEPTPEPAPERPTHDKATDLPLVYGNEEVEPAPEPEPAPEAEPVASEAEAEPKIGTFKTPEAQNEAYENLRRVYDKEQNVNRDLKGDVQSLREMVARLEGNVTALRQPDPAPQEPEPTSEQIADLANQDPAAYANWVANRAVQKADARVQSVEDRLAFSEKSRMQEARTQFVKDNIPELSAVITANGDESKMDPDHVDFAQKFVTLLDRFPDMANSDGKLEEAANAVRGRMLKERTQTTRMRVPKSPAKPPQPVGDVFLESTSGRAASTERKAIGKATAAEIKRQLIEDGVPVIDRS